MDVDAHAVHRDEETEPELGRGGGGVGREAGEAGRRHAVLGDLRHQALERVLRHVHDDRIEHGGHRLVDLVLPDVAPDLVGQQRLIDHGGEAAVPIPPNRSGPMGEEPKRL